jgi:hypothetical protein
MAIDLRIHDKKVRYDGGDCGLFYWDSSVNRYAFASIEPRHLARHINGKSKEQAIRGLVSMISMADLQLSSSGRPLPGSNNNHPFSLNGQRRYVENARKLANAIFEELC